MKIEIKEKILKRFSYERKDGTRGWGFRKSILLSDDSIIRFDKKNNEWKFSSERFDRKISKSLMRGSMIESQNEGKMRIDIEKYSNFQKFSERMIPLMGIENLLKIIKYLK